MRNFCAVRARGHGIYGRIFTVKWGHRLYKIQSVCASALGTLAFMCFLWRLCSSKHTRKCYTAERGNEMCARQALRMRGKNDGNIFLCQEMAHTSTFVMRARLNCTASANCFVLASHFWPLFFVWRLSIRHVLNLFKDPRRQCVHLQIKIEHSIFLRCFWNGVYI